MAGPTDVVIAGTRPFALALFAPVTERAGTRPRIAPEPSMVLTLCADSSGVLVVEYDPRWLPALTLLRQKQPGLRVVAALPRGQEGAALSLGPLQIDAVPWDGQALSVLPAIERAIGGSSARAAASPAVAVVQTLVSPPPVRAASSPGLTGPAPAAPPEAPTLDLFHDLGATAATPIPATQAAVPAMAAPARVGLLSWPASGPSAAEAELLLRGAVAGAVDLSPLRAVTEQTIAGLSPLEREVFTGGTLAVDAELIRHAAVLRLRVAAALASRPPPGTAIDGAAVAELLSEIDGVLGAVKGLLADAPPEVKVSLEAIRNALVKEAVDFSEASHEAGVSDAGAVSARPAVTRPIAATRVVNVRAGETEPEEAQRQRSRLLWVVLALAVLGAGAFHGYRWWKTEQVVAQMQTLPGQPSRMMLLPATPGATTRELVPMGGAPDRAEVERFKAQQRLLGNTVTETSLGGLVIKPEAASPAGEKRSKP